MLKNKEKYELLDKYGESREAIDQHSTPQDWMEYLFAQGDRYLNEVLEERRLKREQSSSPQTPLPSVAQENPNYSTPTNLPETEEENKNNNEDLTANSPLMMAKKLNKYKESSKFDKLINSVFEEEGGYEDNRKKIDQPTNMGIIQSTLDNFNKLHPNLKINKSLKTLSREDAQLIYKLDYYDKYRLEEINNHTIARTMFHMFINSSPTKMAVLVQQSINSLGGKIDIDGVIGSATIHAINQLIENGKSKELNKKLIELRLKYEDNLSDNKKYSGRRKRFERLLKE